MAIIIASRRNETREIAHRLRDTLQNDLGIEVKAGVERLSVAGLKLADAIRQECSQADCLIVLINSAWLGDGVWLNSPTDFNYIALDAAIQANRKLIPVLVDRGIMPKSSDLPSNVAASAQEKPITLNQFDVALSAVKQRIKP